MELQDIASNSTLGHTEKCSLETIGKSETEGQSSPHLDGDDTLITNATRTQSEMSSETTIPVPSISPDLDVQEKVGSNSQELSDSNLVGEPQSNLEDDTSYAHQYTSVKSSLVPAPYSQKLTHNPMNSDTEENQESTSLAIVSETPHQKNIGLKLMEHPTVEDYLSFIPTKTQQGFRNMNVSVSCMDASESFMVFGTNAGCAFMYNRETGMVTRIVCETRSDAVTTVKLLVGIECQIAIGTEDGKILILILSNNTSTSGRVIQKFPLGKVHDSAVTCMEWSKNGLKLFSGDKKGNIYLVDRDFERNSCNVTFVHSESDSIVDLSYRHMILLISTMERTVLYHTNLNDDKIKPVGSKARQGVFGACFTPDSVSISDLQVFCARPGYRIWIANLEGKVTNTLLLKDLVLSSITNITMQDKFPALEAKDQQFRKISFFNDKYLLTFSATSVILIDPSKPTISANHQDLPDILDVAITTEEIFILRKDRKLHRIAEKPDEIAIRRKRLMEEEKRKEGQAQYLQDVKDSLSEVKKNLTPLVGALQSKMSSLNEGAGHWSQRLQSQAKLFQRKLPLFSKEEKDPAPSFSAKELVPQCSVEEADSAHIDDSNLSDRTEPDFTGNGRRLHTESQTSSGSQESSSSQESGVSSEQGSAEVNPAISKNSGEMATIESTKQGISRAQDNPDSKSNDSSDDHNPSSVNLHFEKLEKISSEEAPPGDIVFVSRRKKKTRTASTSKLRTPHQKNNLDATTTVSNEERSEVKVEKLNGAPENQPDSKSVGSTDVDMADPELSSQENGGIKEENDLPVTSHARLVHNRISISGALAEEGSSIIPPSDGKNTTTLQHNQTPSDTTSSYKRLSPHHNSSDNSGDLISRSNNKSLTANISLPEELPSNPLQRDPDKILPVDPSHLESLPDTNRQNTVTPPILASSSEDTFLKTLPEGPSSSTVAMAEKVSTVTSETTATVTNNRNNQSLEFATKCSNTDTACRQDSNFIAAEVKLISQGANMSTTGDERPPCKIFPRKPGSISLRNQDSLENSLVLSSEQSASIQQQKNPLFSDSENEGDFEVQEPGNIDQDESESIDIYNGYSFDCEDEPKDDHYFSLWRKQNSEVLSSQTFVNDMAGVAASFPAKLFDSWSSDELPHQVSSISGSGSYIWFIDTMHNIYISEQCQGKWIRLTKKGFELSISPSGDVIWLVGNFGKAYAATMPVQLICDTLDLEWKNVDSGVCHVALGHDSVWLVTTNGKIKVQFGISRSYPYQSSWNLVPWDKGKISSIVSTKSTVWCLTDEGVLYSAQIDSIDLNDFKWEKVEIPSSTDGTTAFVQTMTADSQNILFITDNFGVLWFVTEDRKWWQIIASEYIDNDSYSSVQSLPLPTSMASAMYKVKRWMQGLLYAQFVAVNDQATWIVHDKYKTAVARGPLTGQRWDVTTPLGVSKSSKWKQITTSSVFSSRHGSWIGLVWASRSNGEIYCFPSQDCSTVDPKTLEPPVQTRISIISMSACKEALWVLLSDGSVYIRSGISADCIQGIKWNKLDTTEQLGKAKLVHVSCGSQNVWAVDSDGKVYFRIGVTAVDRNSLPPAWIPIESCPSPGHRFTQIECGSSDGNVWALDDFSEVYVRTEVSSTFPVGAKWEIVPGSHAQQICISNHTVWGLRSGGNLIRRYGISERNEMGDYWKKIRGKFTRMAVTPYDELWAIDEKEHLCHRYTTVYCPLVVEAQYQIESTQFADYDRSPPRSTERDWEFL